ncbi:MAG: murein transglycosylase A [Sphingomonadaceae bacterium]
MRLAAGLLALALAGCVRAASPPLVVVAPSPPTVQPVLPADARAAGVIAGTDIATLPIDGAAAARGLAAFRLSCPALLRRTDRSGLSVPTDWQPTCDAAKSVADDDALAFFRTQFETVQVGAGTAFATGYYEPEITGSRVAGPGFAPVYAKPGDLIDVDLGAFRANLKGRSVSGRIADGRFVPYFDRGQIEDGALAGRGLELAWAVDPIELFFLQVQGSGRLRMNDGTVLRIGYSGQNGHDYTGIGALMRQRGLVAPGQASMQGLMAWLRANPEAGRAIMRENRSWVFFRVLTGPGPLGALELPVTARASVAADPAFVPLGAPVFLTMDRAEASGLWIAQDTGGAIKGANRFDTFWGAGEEARTIAGGMVARGTAVVLLPRGALARLAAKSGADAAPLP